MGEEYQEIDLVELLSVILRRWWLIAILVVLSGGIAYYVTSVHITPQYEAEATLFIGKEADLLGDFSLSDLSIDNKLVVDYRELLKTRLVSGEVIETLGLNISTEKLTSKLSVETVSDSRFIHIKFTDANPEVAAIITNKLAEVLVAKAVEVIGIQNVRIVDAAIVPVDPISPNLTMNVAIAVVLGGMLALFIIFAMHMIDNTITKEEQLEKRLGIPVLGVIPEHKEEK